MFFDSYFFLLLFLPLAIAGYFLLGRLLPHSPANRLFLLLCSLWFYGSHGLPFLLVLFSSAVINYLLAAAMGKQGRKKGLLLIGLLFHIGLLVLFKYFDFFLGTFNSLTGLHLPLLRLIAPLGLSFFTFQQIAYLVDRFRGEAPLFPPLDYACSLCFFPYIMSGPISLHTEIIPQLRCRENRFFQWENFSKGLVAFSFGMAKKVLLADTLGQAADWGFTWVEGMNTPTAFLVMLCYTLQLYFDFSGYCDMATGLGLFFNIQLPQNFDSPYRAFSVREFWKRWHMTLTRFFTRYLYIPLGGSRKGRLRTYGNTLLVFLVSGLWHGANWTFVLWGLLHGLAQIVERIFEKPLEKLHPGFRFLGTFAFINLTWVIFRAPDLHTAFTFLGNLFRMDLGVIDINLTAHFDFAELLWLRLSFMPTLERWNLMLCLLFIGFCLFASIQLRNTHERLAAFRPRLSLMVCCVLLLFWSVLSFSGVSGFLYVMF